MALVRIGQVAHVLNISERRIQQLAKEGLPREERGKYDLANCMIWYIRYLQKKLESKSLGSEDFGRSSFLAEKRRLVKADAELREIELAEKRKQLVSIADVEKSWTDLILEAKARVLAIAPRIAADLVGETSRVMIQAKIEKAAKDALALLEKRKA